jgi:hypothetical protein
MRKALKRLSDLQACLARGTEEYALPSEFNHLSITTVAGQVHLDYFGTPFDEGFQQLLETVITPEVSAVLASLTLRGPDEGSNGTRNWDISRLADSTAIFPRLRALSIEQTKPTDHNRSIVAAGYEEEGVLARFLTRAPDLRSLVTPSAPDASFFRIDDGWALQYLNVDSGYDTQGFIRNLARSSCFSSLSHLEFGEFNERHMEDYAAHCTPFGDYEELFGSEAFKRVQWFVWRNPVCSDTKIRKLKGLRPDLQLQVVRTSAEYVR